MNDTSENKFLTHVRQDKAGIGHNLGKYSDEFKTLSGYDAEAHIKNDGSYELRIPYSDSCELVMDILKHGENVEVIEPISLRQLLSKHLQQTLQQYEK